MTTDIDATTPRWTNAEPVGNGAELAAGMLIVARVIPTDSQSLYLGDLDYLRKLVVVNNPLSTAVYLADLSAQTDVPLLAVDPTYDALLKELVSTRPGRAALVAAVNRTAALSRGIYKPESLASRISTLRGLIPDWKQLTADANMQGLVNGAELAKKMAGILRLGDGDAKKATLESLNGLRYLVTSNEFATAAYLAALRGNLQPDRPTLIDTASADLRAQLISTPRGLGLYVAAVERQGQQSGLHAARLDHDWFLHSDEVHGRFVSAAEEDAAKLGYDDFFTVSAELARQPRYPVATRNAVPDLA